MASSLFDALANGAPEKAQEITDAMSGDFAKKVDRYTNMIVDGYLKNSIDVNKSIARIAEKENLNDDQISRIIEEVNNQIYLHQYNQMKNAPQREVSFDIAALPKIKEVIKSGESNKPINQQKEASPIESAFEKKASWEGDNGDKLNFLNFSAYETSGLVEDKPADRKGYLEKITLDKLASMEQEIEKGIEKIATNAYTIAEALIKYDRANVNAQEIFCEICKKANLDSVDQQLIKDGITQKIAQLQEYKVVSEDYNFGVDYVDTEKVADEFSLGRYSFMEKLAINSVSNQNVPVVVTDAGTIRNINDIIDLASGMTETKQEVQEKQNNMNDIRSRITDRK